MIRHVGLVCAATLTVVLVGCLPAWADPTSTPTPTPTPGPTGPTSVVPQGATRPFTGDSRELTFPVANLDGSMIADDTVITLKADVFFAYNTATLNANAGAVLDSGAVRLKELGATRVRVEGHTDDTGAAAHNERLSERRAQAVGSALGERLPGVRISVKAYGETRPVADNDTAKGRALNRRVAITLTG